MKFFPQRGRYVFRIVFITLLVIVGLHFCNMAGYYGWSRDFPQNKPYVDILTRRYYFFIIVFLVLMTAAIVIFVRTIKQIKKDKLRRKPIENKEKRAN